MEDQQWKIEYLSLLGNRLTDYQRKILEQGPKSLSEAWALGAMKTDWKKRTNIK